MSKEQKADWKGFDWNGTENCELRKYVSSLEIQLAQVTQERDEARAREAGYRNAAEQLWQLLDNIDTAEDMAKDDDRVFRALAHKHHVKRFEIAKSDGYSLTFAADPSPAYDEWKAMKAELEARREVMTQMCFNEGYGDQAQFDAAWAKLEKALAALEGVKPLGKAGTVPTD